MTLGTWHLLIFKRIESVFEYSNNFVELKNKVASVTVLKSSLYGGMCVASA